jgi:hypothetical protein
MINPTSNIIKSIRSLILLILFSFFPYTSKAQYNLVPNQSFESYINCPSLSYKQMPPPWVLATNQALVYLNACANSSSPCYGVPNNCSGGANYQYPKTGDAYVYESFYDGGVNNANRSYIEVKLKDSLQAGKCYYAGYYINLTDNSKNATNNAGLLFTKTIVYVDTVATPFGVYPANPQIVNYGNPVVKDNQNWVKVSGVFVAQGGEKYITLGNFRSNAETEIKVVNSAGLNWAIYLIDDVFVIPLDSMPLKADAGKDTSIANIGDSVFIGSLTNGITNITWYNSSGTIINTQAPGFFVYPTASTFYIVEQTVCGFTSRDTVNVTVGTVPLKFISYNLISSLRGTKQSVENSWATANETNVSHFNIQRSINGKDFITIGKVAAQNKISNEYSFYDSPPVEGLGVVYYRIESVDFDGRKQYSEIKRVTPNEKQETRNLVIFPNPAKDVVTIECKGMKEFSIVNCLGVEIASGKNLRNDFAVVSVKGFAKGLYIVKLVTANGATVMSKFVKE